jgi:hypothetical protein
MNAASATAWLTEHCRTGYRAQRGPRIPAGPLGSQHAGPLQASVSQTAVSQTAVSQTAVSQTAVSQAAGAQETVMPPAGWRG